MTLAWHDELILGVTRNGYLRVCSKLCIFDSKIKIGEPEKSSHFQI